MKTSSYATKLTIKLLPDKLHEKLVSLIFKKLYTEYGLQTLKIRGTLLVLRRQAINIGLGILE